MIIAGGIAYPHALGLVSKNPATGQSQVNAQAKAAERQAKVDALTDSLAAKHAQKTVSGYSPVQNGPKRWSVPPLK